MQPETSAPTWCLYAGVVVASIVLDLASKTAAHTLSSDGFLVRPRENSELALGIASLEIGPVPMVAFGAVVVFVLTYGFRLSRSSNGSAVAYSLLVGGLLGNGIDRAVTGSVRDWLYVGAAVANLADIFIIVGLGWFVVAAWRSVA